MEDVLVVSHAALLALTREHVLDKLALQDKS